jgi:hypothetical protein
MRFKGQAVAALVNIKAILSIPHRVLSYDLATLIGRVHPRYLTFLLLPVAPFNTPLSSSVLPMNFERKMMKRNVNARLLISMLSNGQGGILAIAT